MIRPAELGPSRAASTSLRYFQTATLLANGKVLVAAGAIDDQDNLRVRNSTIRRPERGPQPATSIPIGIDLHRDAATQGRMARCWWLGARERFFEALADGGTI